MTPNSRLRQIKWIRPNFSIQLITNWMEFNKIQWVKMFNFARSASVRSAVRCCLLLISISCWTNCFHSQARFRIISYPQATRIKQPFHRFLSMLNWKWNPSHPRCSIQYGGAWLVCETQTGPPIGYLVR